MQIDLYMNLRKSNYYAYPSCTYSCPPLSQRVPLLLTGWKRALFIVTYMCMYMPTSADPAGRCSPSSTLMHVPTQRGLKAAHRPSGRKLFPPSFPPRFPGVTSRCSGGRVVLAYGCVNDLLRISRPGGRWSTWLNSIKPIQNIKVHKF